MSTRKHAHKAAMAAASATASKPLPSASWWALLVSDVHCVLQRDPAARNLPRWISFMSRCVTQVDIHPGARIGERARIAANSVVIEAVPADATVVGIPGRVVAPERRT
jgi:serine acetyltransferase